MYEVWVRSSRMEGIHLRGAAVARGGIRHSDRPDDFRTEVMGLVLTQVVKNAVIVPSGSKGGFVCLRSLPEREAMAHEAREQYCTLMRGLLDITDNLDGEDTPPDGVIRAVDGLHGVPALAQQQLEGLGEAAVVVDDENFRVSHGLVTPAKRTWREDAS